MTLIFAAAIVILMVLFLIAAAASLTGEQSCPISMDGIFNRAFKTGEEPFVLGSQHVFRLIADAAADHRIHTSII